MTYYQMPVLTEKEKVIIKETCEHMISRSDTSEYSANLRDVAQIALAALTAEPVDPADCFQPVYLVPPVPVIKQEGEQ